MAASDIMLYWGSGSGPCWRVMIVMHEKGITGYNQKLVSFEKKEHKSEEIMKLNPRGQVPTLRIGDIVVCESLAACNYLESVYGNQGNKLIPDDNAQKAAVLQRTYELQNLNKKFNEELVMFMMRSKPEDRTQDQINAKTAAATDELQIWENYLAKQGNGSCIAGKEFSMADVILFPSLAFPIRLGLKLGNKFPHLAAYYERLKHRPSIEASWPPHWKDTENKTVLSDIM